ncbi:MAG: hypothetical protein ACHQPH_23545 [Reyranellales bacterium]
MGDRGRGDGLPAVSLMVWGTIWGVVGMFLRMPIMVVLMIVFAHFETTRPVAVLLSADGRVPEIEESADR